MPYELIFAYNRCSAQLIALFVWGKEKTEPEAIKLLTKLLNEIEGQLRLEEQTLSSHNSSKGRLKGLSWEGAGILASDSVSCRCNC